MGELTGFALFFHPFGGGLVLALSCLLASREGVALICLSVCLFVYLFVCLVQLQD